MVILVYLRRSVALEIQFICCGYHDKLRLSRYCCSYMDWSFNRKGGASTVTWKVPLSWKGIYRYESVETPDDEDRIVDHCEKTVKRLDKITSTTPDL